MSNYGVKFDIKKSLVAEYDKRTFNLMCRLKNHRKFNEKLEGVRIIDSNFLGFMCYIYN